MQPPLRRNPGLGCEMRLAFQALYRDKYYYIGDAELMTAATLMDVGFYFMGPVRLIYQNHEQEMAHMPYHGPIGAFIGKLMQFYNQRLATLAQRRQKLGIYGERNLDTQFIFPTVFSPKTRTLRLVAWGFRLWMRCEWRTWWVGVTGQKMAQAATPAPAEMSTASGPADPADPALRPV